jgi:hypothetical protein
VGNYAGAFELDASSAVTAPQSARSGDTMTVSSTATLGNIGEIVSLNVTGLGDYSPKSGVYRYVIISSTQIVSYDFSLSGSSTADIVTFTPPYRYQNVTVVGNGAAATQRDQVVIGDESQVNVKISNLNIDGSQPTSGQDGYVMTYDDASGKVGLQAIEHPQNTIGIGAISGDSGDGQTLVVTPGINPTAKPIQITVQITGGTLDVGEQLATITSVTSTTFTVSLQDALESGENINVHWVVFD